MGAGGGDIARGGEEDAGVVAFFGPRRVSLGAGLGGGGFVPTTSKSSSSPIKLSSSESSAFFFVGRLGLAAAGAAIGEPNRF